jgi:DNA modification methylase
VKIQTKKLLDLIPSEYNPRKSDRCQEKALSESLKKYGCVEPIIVNEYQLKDEKGNIIESESRYNIIVGGHFRVRELLKLGVDEVGCVIVNLPPEEEKELNIRLNANTGDWNIDLLLSSFNISELETWGFDEKKLETLKFRTEEDILENSLIDDEGNIPELKKKPKTKLGDMFFLGNHRLLCEDCTMEENVTLLMSSDNIIDNGQLIIDNYKSNLNNYPNINTKENKTNPIINCQLSIINCKKADLIITDPPYNVAYEKSKNFGKILNDKMDSKHFYQFLYKAFRNYSNILKEGGGIYVFHSDYERTNYSNALRDTDFYFSQVIVWVKNHFVIGRQDYQNRHEPIIYGWKKGKSHYFTNNRTQSSVIEDKIDLNKLKKDELLKMLQDILQSEKEPTTIIHCDKQLINNLHPTMKPIKLLSRFIINSSKPNELIVDFFGGSGSTMIASEQLSRQCYMMELEPKYCDVIIERWQNLTKQEAVRSDGIKYNEI